MNRRTDRSRERIAWTTIISLEDHTDTLVHLLCPIPRHPALSHCITMSISTDIEFQVSIEDSSPPLNIVNCTGGLLEKWNFMFVGNSTTLKFVADSQTGLGAQPGKVVLVECQLEEQLALSEICISNIVRMINTSRKEG